MRILAVQFASAIRHRPVPRFEPRLGTLLSLLRGFQHEVSLLGLANYDLPAVKNALARSLPQLIYVDVSPVCIDIARRTLNYIQTHEFLPIVAGGDYATIDPAACLSLPGVQAVAVGEPDAPMVTYFERLKDPTTAPVIRGVWLRDETGIAQTEPPHLVEDLDSLPFPERELFGYGDHLTRTGEAEIAVARGCPQRCTYCLNRAFQDLYRDRGDWVRFRSVENVLDEIAGLQARCQSLRSVRFLDHAFAQNREWLSEFLPAYVERVGLPFHCHLRANSTDEAQIAQLKDAGCRQVDVEIISGSAFIRDEIFEMDTSNEQLRNTFAWLRTAGIATRGIVYIGAPYESEASFEETLALLKQLNPDALDARPYHPWPGTAAAQLCREQGWIHTRGEEQHHREEPGLNMPACRPPEISGYIRKLRSAFPTTIGQPWWRRLTSRATKVPVNVHFETGK